MSGGGDLVHGSDLDVVCSQSTFRASRSEEQHLVSVLQTQSVMICESKPHLLVDGRGETDFHTSRNSINRDRHPSIDGRGGERVEYKSIGDRRSGIFRDARSGYSFRSIGCITDDGLRGRKGRESGGASLGDGDLRTTGSSLGDAAPPECVGEAGKGEESKR